MNNAIEKFECHPKSPRTTTQALRRAGPPFSSGACDIPVTDGETTSMHDWGPRWTRFESLLNIWLYFAVTGTYSVTK